MFAHLRSETPPEVITVYIGSLLFWVLLVAGIWLFGGHRERLRKFREHMILQWKPAVGIALVYGISVLLRSTNTNWFSVFSGSAMTFCQAILGLSLARRIIGFEPLPAVSSVMRHERIGRRVLLTVGFALLAVAVGFVASGFGTVLARILGETKVSTSSNDSSMPALWQLFFYFLSGAGISEETVYRLVIVSLFWKLTNRSWIAILVSGLLFGAYHLTPLSGMYVTFWQYPLTQFLSSAFIGMVWAYFYVKRGYETAVLAHTLSDWLPAAVFVLFIQ
jgi:membrane protease YdiL (CAAX protease family)